MTEDRENSKITLLLAFDSMRVFICQLWEEIGRPEELGGLLGALSRNIHSNSPPIDAAQWSDWLDAVSSVVPNPEPVRQARNAIQKHYEKFLKVLDEESDKRTRTLLENLRDEEAAVSWHLVGDYLITIAVSYEAMRAFLYAYWERGRKNSEVLEHILVGLGEHFYNATEAQKQKWWKAVLKAKMN